MTNTLRDHGTGWAETELVMDVVALYREWDGESELDFTDIVNRLSAFHDAELIEFKTVLTMLSAVIQADLAKRSIPQ